MGTLLAKNADVVVTMDGQRRELRNAGLFARDGMIEKVGPTAELPESADLVLDLRGHILLPGLINCHHHLDQILTRNLPAGQNTNLFPWLKAHYRVWASRTPEDTRTAVLVGCAELARSGCTTVFDHAYVFKNGCKVDDQIAAAAELGLRFAVSRGSMSLGQSKGGLPPDDCVEDENAILKDSIRVIERYHDSAPGSMLQIVLAPCSPFSVTAELMRESAKMARHYGVKLHTHLCETLDEERYTLQHRGLRPVAYMESLDWVGQDVWYAHAVHVNDEEIRLFANKGAGVCHCPSSNMRLASGIAPVKKYRDAGVRTGLGVDGSASNDGSNLLIEVREAMLLARLKIGLAAARGAADRVVDLRSAAGQGVDDGTRRTGDRYHRRRRFARAQRYRRAGAGQVRRLLHARPRRHRLCRRLERSGRGGGVLRTDRRAPYGRRRTPDRRRWRDRHARHGSRHPRA